VAPLDTELARFLHHSMQKNVLGRGLLAATATDTDAVDNVALLGLVSEAASLIRARGAAGTVDDLQLAKLSMHSQQCSTRYTNWGP
jgi:hypothetical protein